MLGWEFRSKRTPRPMGRRIIQSTAAAAKGAGFLLCAACSVLPAPTGVRAQIPGLDQALDPTVTVGSTLHIPAPPSSARNCSTPNDGLSVDSVRDFMESYKGPGSVYDTVHVNYPTVQYPALDLDAIGPLIQQPYDSLVMTRVNTPAVTSIDVEHLTLVYPAGYYSNPLPVTVRARRLTFHAAGRTLVAYYVNYDKLPEHGHSVIWQINGHFGPNPTRQGLGIENNGGLSGAALGKIAMQGLPLISYDDHNVGESSSAPDSLPRTLENLQLMDRTLMTHFDRVDVVGLSGGTERAYHLMLFFESHIRSVYCGGFAVPLWTRLVVPPFGSDGDTHDVLFLQNFQFADLAVMGLHRGVHTAFTHSTFEGGRSKYGYFVEMVPTMQAYTSDFETRGDDLNGDGVSDTGRNLCHEYDLVDLLDWIAYTRAIHGGLGTRRIFHVDAAAPGGYPKHAWKDWESGADLAVLGPDYSRGDAAYAFDGVADFMQGLAADESLFDFGRTDAWTLVVYARADGDAAHEGGLVSKMTAPGGRGWATAWQKHDRGEYVVVRGHDAADRSYKRVDAGTPDTHWHLVVMSMSGPHINAVGMYEDTESPLPDLPWSEPEVAGSMLNDEPLRVGFHPLNESPGSDYFKGQIGFVEIWQGVLAPAYAAYRWNGGSPIRRTQCPLPVPISVAATTGVAKVSFQSAAGEGYRLEYAADLDSPQWSGAGLVVYGKGGGLTVCDPRGLSRGSLYRLAVEPAAASGRIFYVDAALPGPDPAATWTDWAGGADMQNHGAVHNPALASYTFDGSNTFMEGSVAHESRFDFERDHEWSLVVYAKANGDGQHTEGILSKVSVAANMGWQLAWRKHEFGWYEMVRAHHNGDRSYRRADSGSADLDWHLAVISMTGPHISHVAVYEDGGASLPDIFLLEPQVSGSMLNDEPLRIGLDPFTGADPKGAYFHGEIGFIEIWDEALPRQYAIDRWNGGNPARGLGPEAEIGGLEIAANRVFLLDTVAGFTYRLESALDGPTPDWVPAGLTLSGNGGVMRFMDPAGHSTQRVYRVLME